MDIREEDILGRDIATHWYYQSKGRALLSFLHGTRVAAMLDVGAGSGIFSRQLLDAGICESATCVDPAYPEEYTETYNGKEIVFARSVARPDHKLVLMMDVLEHVDDDTALLRQYASSIPPGSQVLISVPAFDFLWSGHDVFLEHRRRYTRQQIEDVVSKAGLEVVRSRYFFGFLLPLVAAIRLYRARKLKKCELTAESDLRKVPALFNTVLTLIHDVERVTLFPVNIFAGLSIFCLARRR